MGHSSEWFDMKWKRLVHSTRQIKRNIECWLFMKYLVWVWWSEQIQKKQDRIACNAMKSLHDFHHSSSITIDLSWLCLFTQIKWQFYMIYTHEMWNTILIMIFNSFMVRWVGKAEASANILINLIDFRHYFFVCLVCRRLLVLRRFPFPAQLISSFLICLLSTLYCNEWSTHSY